jgi:glycosyltransferase involved in cell wall biosynthesis
MTRTRRATEISVVVPIWNDAATIKPFLSAVVNSLNSRTSSYEIIFCVDPSKDNTKKILKSASTADPRIKALFFGSRAGQAGSSMAGLRHAVGKAVIVIDADLQDPVELIPQMIDMWKSGSKLIIPRRKSRTGEPFTKKMTAALGYAFLDKFGNAPIPRHTGDYRLMDKSVVEKVLALRETHVFLRGLVALVDQSPEFLEFDRPRRNTGRTKYNLWFGGIRSGLNGIVSYSTALLDWIIVTGLLLAVVSFFFGLKYFIYKISGFYIAPGNTQLFVMVTFIGGMQLVALGVLGLYVGRIFEEVKNRPRWFITETLAIDKKDFHDSARSGAM